MQVLVDTSVWIDYFRGEVKTEDLDVLIDENLIVSNEIILAELLPFLKVKNEIRLISILQSINMNRLNIHWNEIVEYQIRCLESGANGIGIPDLIITQNALQNDCMIYTRDKHFSLMREVLKVRLYEEG